MFLERNRAGLMVLDGYHINVSHSREMKSARVECVRISLSDCHPSPPIHSQLEGEGEAVVFHTTVCLFFAGKTAFQALYTMARIDCISYRLLEKQL